MNATAVLDVFRSDPENIVADQPNSEPRTKCRRWQWFSSFKDADPPVAPNPQHNEQNASQAPEHQLSRFGDYRPLQLGVEELFL
jgi:hypothetical protein